MYTLGVPFSVGEIEAHVEEENAEFDCVHHKVPPVNSVQMYKFLNPPKSIETIGNENSIHVVVRL